MSRRTLSNLDKLKLILASLQENATITKLCAERGISRSTFYRCRKLMLVGLEVLFLGNKKMLRDSKVSDAYKRRYRCSTE